MKMVERLSKTSGDAARRHQVGELLGDYRLESVLHADGVTEIYRAVNVRDDSVCLVKCFGVSLTEHDVEVVEGIMKHENDLLQYSELSVNKEVNVSFAPLESNVVSKCKEGRSLSELLRNEGPLSESYCLAVMRNTVLALKPFEAAGLGYGGLTLDGVHVASDGSILLENRGFAGLTGCFSAPETTCEQVDVRSDFYSIGAMMYMLLTGHEPFGNAGQMMPLWEMRPELSSDLVLLVHRLLNENPDERPADVEEMLACLDGVDLSRHLAAEELQEIVDGGGQVTTGRNVRKMKAVSAETKRRRNQTGGSWIMKVSYVALFVLAFCVGYGLAVSRDDALQLPLVESVLKVSENKEDAKEEQLQEAIVEERTEEDGFPSADVEMEGVEEMDTSLEAEGNKSIEIPVVEQDEDEEQGFVADDGKPEEKAEKVVVEDEKKKEKEDKEDEEKKVKISEEAQQRQKQLEAALKRRNAKEIKTLIDAGAKLDWVSEDGTSLLQQACARGHWDAVEFMLKQGADVNWRPRVPGEKFKMPLQIAIDNGRKVHGAVLMLLKHKADPEILFNAGVFFKNNGDDAGALARKNIAGIVAMCQHGYLRDNHLLQQEVFNAWYEANKDDLTDELKAQVIANAIEQKMSKGFLKTAMQRVKSMKAPQYGRVLLAAMKHKNRIELLGRLKTFGINVNAECEIEKDGVIQKETPLYYAVREKADEDVIRWLLANGANVKWTNEDGKTVMDLDMNPKIKTLLLEARQGKKVVQEWNDNLYTTGMTTIRPNMPWDADLNAVTVKGEHSDWITSASAKDQKLVEADVDFFWSYDIENKKLTLEPRNGCEVLPMTNNLTPFQQVQVSYIAKQKFSDRTLEYTKDESSPLKSGSVVLFRTSKGNFGKFRVARYEDEVIDKKKRRNVAIRIHWVVYHLREEDVRESHSKRTIW